jgi:hypothetical protein
MSMDAIATVVRDYVEGMVLNDEPKLRRAFHPKASIMGNYEGAVEWLTLDEFAASIADTAAGPAATPVWTIRSAQIWGDTASAVVEDEFAGMKFIDTLSLLAVDGSWKIVSKVYHLRA